LHYTGDFSSGNELTSFFTLKQEKQPTTFILILLVANENVSLEEKKFGFTYSFFYFSFAK
jgi:hypothetical protein